MQDRVGEAGKALEEKEENKYGSCHSPVAISDERND